MVLFGICGELGAGKTLALTFLGFKNWLYRRRKVYSNYPLYGIPYIFLRAVNQFDNAREGFILADELWLICDSRLSLTSKNRFVASILSRSRKRNLNISFTTQLLDSLDKRIRKILDFSALPVLNPNETIEKVNIFRTGYPKLASYMKTFYFKTPLVFNMYDSILPDQKVMWYENDELHIDEIQNFKSKIESTLIPTYNFNTNKMELKKPKAFIKHYVEKDGYEITTTYNRKIKVTGDHSIFSYKNGKFDAIPVRDLKIGDKILISKSLPVIEKDVKELKVGEIVEKIWHKKKINMKLLAKVDGFDNDKLLRISKDYKLHYLYRKNKYLPYDLAKKLGLLKDDTKITSRYLNKSFPNSVKIDDDFLWLLGLILAEGCITCNDNQMSISSEQENLDKSRKILKKIFNLNMIETDITIFNGKIIRSGSLFVQNRSVCLFFKCLLENYQWIIQLPKKKLKWFLYGFWQGDGYHNGNAKMLTFTTSNLNDKNITELITAILSRFSIVWSITRQKGIRESLQKYGKRYRNVKYDCNLIRGNVTNSILEFDKKIDETTRCPIINDGIVVKIKKMKKFNIKDFVYDFSIEDNHNFLTGDMIIAKNTNYEIEMEEETDQDPEIIFQETRDKSAQYFDTFEEADSVAEQYWEKRQNELKTIF